MVAESVGSLGGLDKITADTCRHYGLSRVEVDTDKLAHRLCLRVDKSGAVDGERNQKVSFRFADTSPAPQSGSFMFS